MFYLLEIGSSNALYWIQSDMTLRTGEKLRLYNRHEYVSETWSNTNVKFSLTKGEDMREKAHDQ